MAKIAVLCNTYSQLMCILQIRSTLMSKDDITLILSDHSRRSEEIYGRIKTSHIFDKVVYWKTREMDYSKSKGLYSLKIVASGVLGRKLCNGLCDEVYDLFMYYNYGISESILFSQLYRCNSEIRCARFEEGITSYNHMINMPHNPAMPQKLKLIAILRKLMGRSEIYNRTDTFYCYYPELYNGDLKRVKIPLISKDDTGLMRWVRKVFDINDEELDYPQKFIFFGCIADIEGGEAIGESQIAMQIAEIVGRDNIIVKVHPRDTTDVYVKAGLQIDKNSAKPWEAIQLCKDFSDHVFISTISSSVLTGNMIVEDPAKVVFTYPLCKCDNNSVALDAIRAIQNVLDNCKKKLDYVMVVGSLDEIASLK